MTATHDQLCAIPNRVTKLEEAVIAINTATNALALTIGHDINSLDAYREHLADRIPRLEHALQDALTRITALEGRNLRHRYTPRRQQPIVHGTNRGYRAHRRRQETACPECLDAHAAYNRDHPAGDLRPPPHRERTPI